LLWKDLENSKTTNSALGRDREPSLQSYEQERTWQHQAPPITDAENDFSPQKINQTSDSFCKTHNEMMIQQQYIPAWEEKASLVPFVMQRRSWWEVTGGGRGHVAGYTSGLY
jgi:hypothetical protein